MLNGICTPNNLFHAAYFGVGQSSPIDKLGVNDGDDVVLDYRPLYTTVIRIEYRGQPMVVPAAVRLDCGSCNRNEKSRISGNYNPISHHPDKERMHGSPSILSR